MQWGTSCLQASCWCYPLDVSVPYIINPVWKLILMPLFHSDPRLDRTLNLVSLVKLSEMIKYSIKYQQNVINCYRLLVHWIGKWTGIPNSSSCFKNGCRATTVHHVAYHGPDFSLPQQFLDGIFNHQVDDNNNLAISEKMNINIHILKIVFDTGIDNDAAPLQK